MYQWLGVCLDEIEVKGRSRVVFDNFEFLLILKSI